MTMSAPERDPNASIWGWHLALNLYACNLDLITSAEVIEDYVIRLCDLIKMRRFGDPTIVNFGDDPRVAGYSLVQLIETSNICGHFANESQAVYLDIFSCKKFDPQIATDFSAATFEATSSKGVFIARE
ncbi:MAG: S-adenosylmethionine decarboxylase [Anaerolineae bacterium]|nr:S-adenosylmethionine decarboxylase [Anaerolineae bacterium]